MILIDVYEKGPTKQAIIKYLTDAGIAHDIQKLGTGDFWIICDNGKVVCVERKAVSDLVTSIKQNNLVAQVSRMLESFDYCRLLIQGVMFKPTKISDGPYAPEFAVAPFRGNTSTSYLHTLDARRLIGTLSTIQTSGVIVDWWPGGHLGGYLVHLKQAYEKGWHESETVRPRITSFRRPERLEDVVQRLHIPGVGAVRSRKLAEHYHSLYDLCTGELKDLATLLGIGSATAVHEFFRDSYGKDIPPM